MIAQSKCANSIQPVAKGLALSEREKEVFDMAVEGYTDKEIACRLGIQPSTIKSYWLRIRQKTQVMTRSQAIFKLSSNVVASPQSNWWSALLKHVPFSVLVCTAQYTVLDAVLGGHAIAKMIVGKNLRDCLVDKPAWDRSVQKLTRTGCPQELRCEISYQGWLLAVCGTLLPMEGKASAGLIFIVEKVEDLSVVSAQASRGDTSPRPLSFDQRRIA